MLFIVKAVLLKRYRKEGLTILHTVIARYVEAESLKQAVKKIGLVPFRDQELDGYFRYNNRNEKDIIELIGTKGCYLYSIVIKENKKQ